MDLDTESLEDSFLLSVSDSRRRCGFRGLCTPHGTGAEQRTGTREARRACGSPQQCGVPPCGPRRQRGGCGSKEENVSATKLWDREKGPQRPAGKNSPSENKRTLCIRKQRSEGEKKKEMVKAGFLPPGK